MTSVVSLWTESTCSFQKGLIITLASTHWWIASAFTSFEVFPQHVHLALHTCFNLKCLSVLHKQGAMWVLYFLCIRSLGMRMCPRKLGRRDRKDCKTICQKTYFWVLTDFLYFGSLFKKKKSINILNLVILEHMNKNLNFLTNWALKCNTDYGSPLLHLNHLWQRKEQRN